MYSIPFARCLGISMIPLVVLSTIASLLLLFPSMQHRYLAEGHITPEARYCTGIWLSGFVVLVAARGFASRYMKEGHCLFRADMMCRLAYTCVAVFATGFCFLFNTSGLTKGPLCLYNGTNGQEWGRPLQRENTEEISYLYVPERWASACIEPHGIVMWNMVLFSMIMTTSGLQAFICTVQILHAIVAVIMGPGFRKNQVVPA
ncbi:transmembrane 4 L6 family member 1 [Astyanax mexicanus]|uniref:transmembrane 4 L6 family member 1 n=1 Tax=Astyanax mexicanus TaxID=7994 RepID=UPI0020CB4132|nr:transmembrane 4 L6 family member 1 [Astyanax mexicanus]